MKLIKVIPILLGVLFLFDSCVKEKFPYNGNTPDGEPTLIKLSLRTSFRDEIPSTRAALPVAEESKFKDVRVIIFKSSGEVVTNHKIVYPTATDSPDIKVNTFSGLDRSVYIIANADESLDAKLLDIKTLSELNAIQTSAPELRNGLTDKPLIMIGKLDRVEITSGYNVFPDPIQMEYMSAKLTLKVVDNTPVGHSVTILGWDIENGTENSFLILNGGGLAPKDANEGKEDDDDAWLTTHESLMPFDKIEGKTAYLTKYLAENRQGWRVNRALPIKPYTGMDFTDSDHRGKAWFAPKRATCIVIHAMHKTATESKLVEARIFLGTDNYRNYDISRGKDYQFTVTVNGINDIDVDTNLEAVNGSFAAHASAPLYSMDSHPDFRPIMISSTDGMVSIEIVDFNGRSYNDPLFDATWVKVSPLNLMYHQVRQAAPNDEWQQAGVPGDFVRAKYIPHKSVRATLAAKGGWNTIPVGKEDDDVMTFADATHRMCYKITDIPFVADVVTNKVLCVYTDEFLSNEGTRRAKIKISFKKNGSDFAEEKLLTITQKGYYNLFDESNPDAGFTVLNEDGTLSSTKRMFVAESYDETGFAMHPDIDPYIQKISYMQFGFYDVEPFYDKADKFRNGYFLTAEAVYNDVVRVDNEPTGFGLSGSSLKPKYTSRKVVAPGADLGVIDSIPNYGSGSHSGAPYYYPTATNNIYHPIFKSSAAKYCHEKNRDINGDGFIDASETKWYMPSCHELFLMCFFVPRIDYGMCTAVTQIDKLNAYFTYRSLEGNGPLSKIDATNVHCIRVL